VTRPARADRDKRSKAGARSGDAQKRRAARHGGHFYHNGPCRGVKLDIQNNQVEIKAHGDLLDAKRKETAVINAKYDEDKRRYLELLKTGTVAAAGTAAKK
jgi:hypothetical protein